MNDRKTHLLTETHPTDPASSSPYSSSSVHVVSTHTSSSEVVVVHHQYCPLPMSSRKTSRSAFSRPRSKGFELLSIWLQRAVCTSFDARDSGGSTHHLPQLHLIDPLSAFVPTRVRIYQLSSFFMSLIGERGYKLLPIKCMEISEIFFILLR